MKQNLKIGSVVDDGSGDYLRQGGQKINNNFDELYYQLGDGDFPHAAGAWKTYKASDSASIDADWGKAYVLDTSSGRISFKLPKGTPNDYNKVIRARDVFATWQVNPVTIIPATGDTLKGDAVSKEFNRQFSDLELVYCPPGRWEYVENKQVNQISNSDLATVVRKEFVVQVQDQTDFLDVFGGYDYNIANTQVFHRGNILYYGETFSSDSDYGSPGATPGTLVALNGKDIRLRQKCNVGDTVIVVSYMDGISQWRSSYVRRSIRLLDSKFTNQTSQEGAIYVSDLSTLHSIPVTAFGLDSTSPINPNSVEVRFNGILQVHAGQAGLPSVICKGAEADDFETCSALGGEWFDSYTDYYLEIDDQNRVTDLLFDRTMEHGDIITLTWFNNNIGTVLELEDILDETDTRYVSKGPSAEISGDIAYTDYNNPAAPNIEQVPTYTADFDTVSRIFDSIYPVGTIYENASNPNNPATYMGFGTWKLWGQGKVLAGWNNDISDPNFAYNNNDLDVGGNPSHTAGGTGGTSSNEISNANLPVTQTDEKVLVVDPNGPIIVGGCQFDPDDEGPVYTKYREDFAKTNGTHTPPQSVNNLQPYITVYRWLRIS
jgi:hypothetical protein